MIALTDSEVLDNFNTRNCNLYVDAGNDISICDGGSVTLSGSGAVTYSWDNNVSDGVTSTTTYTVTGTDANGCQANDQVTVTVNYGCWSPICLLW